MGKQSYQSGWYKDDEGRDFHVLGHNMSDETMDALKKLVKAVHEKVGGDVNQRNPNECPYCGSLATFEVERISRIAGIRQCIACGKCFDRVDAPKGATS